MLTIDRVLELAKGYKNRTGKEPNTIRLHSNDYVEVLKSCAQTFPIYMTIRTCYTTSICGLNPVVDDTGGTKVYYEEPQLPEIVCKSCGAPSTTKACEYCLRDR